MLTYVMRGVEMLKKNRATPIIRPDKPDARRLHGASSEVKSPKTVKTNAIR
jgi:hypothetical protein